MQLLPGAYAYLVQLLYETLLRFVKVLFLSIALSKNVLRVLDAGGIVLPVFFCFSGCRSSYAYEG